MNAIAKEIYEATSYGDTEVVKRLLKMATFEDLIYKNPHDLHKTAVMVAAYHGHTEIVRAIFGHSIASVHMQDEAGWTALMFAAYKGHTSTINAILLHPEVDVNVQNKDGWTALILAASEGRPCSVRALLTRKDIDVNIQNNQDGGTALLLACIRGYTEIVRDLLSVKGVKVNLEDNEGRLPVFAAKNDEITALINFYDPEVGLVYPVHDLPAPPTHTVAPMPPLPPAHSPQPALSVEYNLCADEVHALLPLLPYICIRGQWHKNRVALQHKMEAAVHIHHHKEAALIGRELLAFKATTASTPALRALSENDYLHLPDKVALLLQRVHKLCEKLALAQDFDTLDQAAVLVVGAEQVQAALAQVNGEAPPKSTALPTSATTTSTTSSTPEAEHHPVVRFGEQAVIIGNEGKGVGVVEVVDDSPVSGTGSGSAGVSKCSSDDDHKVHFAEQAVLIDSTGTGVDVVKVTDEPHEVHVLEGATGVVSGSVHLSHSGGSPGVGGEGSEDEHKVHFAEQAVLIGTEGKGVGVVEVTDEPHEVHVLEGATGVLSGSVHLHPGGGGTGVEGSVMPPPPPNTPSHGLKKGTTSTTASTTATTASALPPPPARATATITADPEYHYLPQYTAYTNTVPQGEYGVHTISTALEALAASQTHIDKLQAENESLRELNRTLSGGVVSGAAAGATTEGDVLMPPPPPSV